MADVLLPTSVAELVAARAADPGALLLAGGTDLMVAVNAGWTAPRSVVALRRVEGLRGVRVEGVEVVVGAGTTYRALLAPDVVALVPALAEAGWRVPRPRPAFGHGVRVGIDGSDGSVGGGGPDGGGGPEGLELFGCFHVSQRNTFTGKLTPAMLREVLSTAARAAELGK